MNRDRLLLIGGLAFAAIRPQPVQLPSIDDSTAAAATGGSAAYQAGPAGSVELAATGGTLVIGSVSPAAGWTYTIETRAADEVKVRFTNQAGREIEFEAEAEDGGIQLEGRPGSGSILGVVVQVGSQD